MPLLNHDCLLLVFTAVVDGARPGDEGDWDGSSTVLWPLAAVCRSWRSAAVGILYRHISLGTIDRARAQGRLAALLASVRLAPTLGALVRSVRWRTHSHAAYPATTAFFDGLDRFPALEHATFRNWADARPPAGARDARPVVRSITVDIPPADESGSACVWRPRDWVDVSGLQRVDLRWDAELPESWHAFLDCLPLGITDLRLSSLFYPTSPSGPTPVDRLLARLGPGLHTLHLHPFNDGMLPARFPPALFASFDNVEELSLDVEDAAALAGRLPRLRRLAFGVPGLGESATPYVPRFLLDVRSCDRSGPAGDGGVRSFPALEQVQLRRLTFANRAHRTDADVVRAGRALADPGVALVDQAGKQWEEEREKGSPWEPDGLAAWFGWIK